MKHQIILFAALAALSASAAVPFELGLAGYTMHRRNLDDTLTIMKKADVHYLCVKDFHLKYTASDAEIAAFKEKCATAGVVPYALGPLYTKNNEAVRAYFEFAKRFGVKVIVGVPYDATDANDSWNKRKGSRSQLEYINQLVKEFDIRYAIHNHGPASPDMYPDVAYGYNLVKDLDPRIGFCLDIGWEYGCGNDPCATIEKYGNRIYDIHLKNFEVGKPNGAAIPLPWGKINYVKVFKTLANVGYNGVCSLEYEKDFDDNLAPIAESIGYARGICDTLQVKAVMKPVPAGANQLTEQEQREGFKLLFDGKKLPTEYWVGVKNGCQTFPEKGWFVQDGCLTMRPMNGISPEGQWFPLPPEDQKLAGGGDIVTKDFFTDFVFKFDFRLTRAANSGVKYFIDEKLNGGTGEEYQILEEGHPDSTKGLNGNRRIASLYDIIPANADQIAKGIGEWNSGEIRAQGAKVEHWLNGVKVLEYTRGTKEFTELVNASKYATWGKDAAGKAQPWGEVRTGRLLLQDHSDSTVSFCNLKVKAL